MDRFCWAALTVAAALAASTDLREGEFTGSDAAAAIVAPAHIGSYAAIVAPEQIHLSLGKTPDIMTVQWASDVGTNASALCASAAHVRYWRGNSSAPPADARRAAGACSKFDLNNTQLVMSLYTAALVELAASTVYSYRVEVDGGNRSEVFQFAAAPDAETVGTTTFLLYGDMGVDRPHPGYSTDMPLVSKEIIDGRADLVVHVGDFGYNLDSNRGDTGRRFMNAIQNYSARAPYMVSLGNHESMYGYAYYAEFFRGAAASQTDASRAAWTPTVTTSNGVAPNNFFYSFDYGLTHVVALNGEVVCAGGDAAMIAAQYAWLEADLAAANANRSRAPWIIAHSHRPMYCTANGNCEGPAAAMRGSGNASIEALFYAYGVDFYFSGHVHNYERLADVAPGGISTQTTVDMPATTHVVVGGGGSDEGKLGFHLPNAGNRSLVRLEEFGYGRLVVHNASHARWQYECTEAHCAAKPVVDDVWFVQRRHGSFANRTRDSA